MPSSTSKNSKTSRPTLDVLIPTLNSQKVLNECLKSIALQDYPKTLVTLYIIDGGSSDSTLSIAKKYKAIILANPKKTAEAAKAIGIKNSSSKYFALIDSDNILPDKNWLTQMIAPLEEDPSLIGSEPLSFTYRPNSGYIERYASLFGINDPYALVAGIYDRQSLATNNWTSLPIESQDKNTYLKILLDPKNNIPTIGANGTVYRRKIFSNFKKDFLFDIDFISNLKSKAYFAKTKNSIIHSYCESSIKKFYRKQKRRVIDLYTYQNLRTQLWHQDPTLPLLFVIYTLTFFPVLYHSLKVFVKSKDHAAFFHLLATYLTLFIYVFYTLKFKLGLLKPLSRAQWQQ